MSKKPKPRSRTQRLLDDLEAQGIVARTGQHRFNSRGELCPVYQLTPAGQARAAIEQSEREAIPGGADPTTT
jgi:hypothetical protein